MMILVLGKPDSGKSKRAEEIVMERYENGERIYLATMIPFGDEGERRVLKHRKMREGKGFFTIECPGNLKALEDNELWTVRDKNRAICLLECVSNLVGNEMHEKGRENWDDRRIAGYVTEEIEWLSKRVKDLVAVSNEFEVQDDFDEDTKRYIEICSMVNRELIKLSERVVT